MRPFALLFYILLFTQWAHGSISNSNNIFLPEQDGFTLGDFQKTPISWWNFLYFNTDVISKEKACEIIKTLDKDIILFNPCAQVPVNAKWVDRWAKEYLLHTPPPEDPKNIEETLKKVLVQLSLPLPSDQLEVLRNNPLTPFSKLEESFAHFFESPAKRGSWQMIPILLNYPPSDIETTESKFSPLLKSSKNTYWTGPHIGTFQNQQTVMIDVQKVIAIGSILLFCLFFFLILKGRMAYLLLLPIISISTLFAYLGVNLIWGSIHGLTLAFGSGLIGISMDYAFHGWKNEHDPFLWRSNGIGFLTTFGAFLLLSLFSIPLIKQISLFTCIGLASAFSLSYFLSYIMSGRWQIRTLDIPKIKLSNKVHIFLLCLFVSSALFASVKFTYDFSLRKMDFSISMRPEGITDSDLIDRSHQLGFLQIEEEQKSKLKDWSENSKISVMGPHLLLPEINFNSNLKKWRRWSCSEKGGITSLQRPPYSGVFKEFLDFLSCENLQKLDKNDWQSSVDLFRHGASDLYIIKSKSLTDLGQIKNDWPDTFFISEFALRFSTRMKQDTSRYLIIILIFITLLLALFFRQRLFLVTLPTTGGILGLFLYLGVSEKPGTFMTFIGVLILLGLTLDYGIFCTAFLKEGKPLKSVFGAVTLSALTSICGFAPLIFCKHPVLQDLGSAIISGLLGACLITFLAYPLFKQAKESTLC